MCKKISEKISQGEKLRDMKTILESYDGDCWNKYTYFCGEKYVRNEVYKDDNIEVYLLCWNKNQSSGIHNHPENGCILKLIDGSLTEDIYVMTDKMTLTKTTKMKPGDTSYLEGKNGLHDVKNNVDESISLHIYPPNYVPEYF